MESNTEIDLFWHICAIGRWKEIVADQMETLRSSGLLKSLNKIHATVLGSSFDLGFLNEPKIEIRNKDEDIKHYESLCLNDLRNWSSDKHGKVLYIHSKGVSRPDHQFNHIWEWRKMMEYFLVEKWQDCVFELDSYDTVGCNISSCGFGLHYSGNFWWSKSSYLRNLKEIVIGKEECGFWKCETWIMSGNPKYLEIYRDEENQHYYDRSPKDYRGQE